MTTITSLSMIFDGFVELAFFSLGTLDLHLRINKVNDRITSLIQSNWQKMQRMKRTNINLRFEKFFIEHNNLCYKVKRFSDFWKDIYLTLILTMFPTTLILLHMVIFEQMETYYRIFNILIIMNIYFALFVLQYFFASLSHKMHRQCKLLARSQWLFNKTNSSLAFKLKIQTYFEKLSSNKRIGFSIGTLVVITFPLFSGVCVHSILNICDNLIQCLIHYTVGHQIHSLLPFGQQVCGQTFKIMIEFSDTVKSLNKITIKQENVLNSDNLSFIHTTLGQGFSTLWNQVNKWRILSNFCMVIRQTSPIGGWGETPYPPRAADPPPPPAGGERSEPLFFSGFSRLIMIRNWI